jgi:hypothetical protein
MSLRRALDEELEEAGGEPMRGVTPHSLRRNFFSLLFSLPQPPSVPYVMAQVGHNDPKVTLDIYAQVIGSKDDHGAALDGLIGDFAESVSAATSQGIRSLDKAAPANFLFPPDRGVLSWARRSQGTDVVTVRTAGLRLTGEYPKPLIRNRLQTNRTGQSVSDAAVNRTSVGLERIGKLDSVTSFSAEGICSESEATFRYVHVPRNQIGWPTTPAGCPRSPGYQ